MLARRFSFVCVLAAMFGMVFAQIVRIDARQPSLAFAGTPWTCGSEGAVRCVPLAP